MKPEHSPTELSTNMVTLRRRLHQFPELCYKEEKTAQILIEALQGLGIPFEYGGVGGGIVARLPGVDSDAPCIALRAEMDALPVTEDTGLPFASRHPGSMHACGHDGHMAMVMGAAELLKHSPPAGDVVLIFQPAEEGGRGAEVMVQAGSLEGVDMIFAAHLTRHYQSGRIMAPEGLVSAQADRLKLHLTGRGGHGARPFEGSDVVTPAAALVMALQALVTRETDPFHPSVISIGTLHAGSVHNAIADHAELDGNIRTGVPETRARILAGIERMARSIGEAYDTQVEAQVIPMYPPVINQPFPTAIARRAALAVVGEQQLVLGEMPSMGAEDFSFFLAQVPGCYVRFGARPPGEANIPLHSPTFDFDEQVLPVGARYFDRVVREAMVALAEVG